MPRKPNPKTSNKPQQTPTPKRAPRFTKSTLAPIEVDVVNAGFDIESLRISQDYVDVAGVEETIVDVPCVRPDNQTYFRVSPDPELRLQTYLYKDQRDRAFYLVDKSMWNAPVLIKHRQPHELVVYIDQYGVLRLWPLRMVDDAGRDNDFWATARRAARTAEKVWTRIEPHISGKGYRILAAEDSAGLGEPIWPSLDLKAIVDMAFEGRCIDSNEHPIVRGLRGLKRSPGPQS